MDNKLFHEKWSALQPKIKQKWSKFSDQELKQINGDKNKFLNDLQKKYGIDKTAAEKELYTLSQTMVGSGASMGKPNPSSKQPENKGRPNKK